MSILCRALILTGCLCLSACTTLAYYSQSVHGHLQVMLRSQPVEYVLQDNSVPTETARKLRLVLDLLQFANERLHLPDNGSYRHYSDINRPYVIWNVFATAPLSLQPRQWCYLIVGCLGYRGYYARADATGFARGLQDEGLETFVGGVTAYSTLGWFSDPVLNTMLRRDDGYLIRVIFHELAHQKLYIRHDTEFNEAFADAVAVIGTRLWHRQKTSTQAYERTVRQLGYDQEFSGLILEYKNRLQKLYASNRPDAAKFEEKRRLFTGLQQRYQQLRASWLDYTVYDSWMNDDLNNAKLAAFATYRELVPDFLALYEAGGRDLQRFYQQLASLADCEHDERRSRLRSRQIPDNC
ncbi:MAG: aminopeptidase [Thiotrichales bacterium]|nr:aminopeptidase [Thiotrichales bacterium]